jgi:hypothetical protein
MALTLTESFAGMKALYEQLLFKAFL